MGGFLFLLWMVLVTASPVLCIVGLVSFAKFILDEFRGHNTTEKSRGFIWEFMFGVVLAAYGYGAFEHDAIFLFWVAFMFFVGFGFGTVTKTPILKGWRHLENESKPNKQDNS